MEFQLFFHISGPLAPGGALTSRIVGNDCCVKEETCGLHFLPIFCASWESRQPISRSTAHATTV